MIPILYEKGTTTYTNNGIGRLTDCLSCSVTEGRNDIYEVELTYPITGIHYEDITVGRIICVSHDEQKDIQPFIIYEISKPISGIVTIYCHHISYLLSTIVVSPFTGNSASAALAAISSNSMSTNPFTFWTDNVTAGSVDIKTPVSARAALGGVEGSVLDVFGGEYEFDKFLVRNYAHRGANNGVTIRYGKNLTDVTYDRNDLDLYDSVVPYWTDGESTVVYGNIVTGTGQTMTLVTPLDLSTEFSSQPTTAQLQAKALTWLDANTPWIPKVNITVDFVALWQTKEYESIAPLERVQLCDTVTVIYTELGVQATAKVIRVVWDALLERYSKIELGDAKASFADTVIGQATSDVQQLLSGVVTTSFLQQAIDDATSLITGGMGGNIVFHYDANGKPVEMLVMDTADESTAVNVLRINVNGIGFSSTGVSGTYTSAWTLNGAFVADFITAGTMSADRIRGGTLILGGLNNTNGTLYTYNASNHLENVINNDGLNIYDDGTYVGRLTAYNDIDGGGTEQSIRLEGEHYVRIWTTYNNHAVGYTQQNTNMQAAHTFWGTAIFDDYVSLLGNLSVFGTTSCSNNVSITRNVESTFLAKNSALNSKMGTTTPSANTAFGGFRIRDSADYDVSYIRAFRTTANLVYSEWMLRRKNSADGVVSNYVQLRIDSNDNTSVTVSAPAAWRSAIAAVNKAGDTMTGSLTVGNGGAIYVKNTGFTVGTAPASDVYGVAHYITDNAGTNVCYYRAYAYTTGEIGAQMETRRTISSNNYYNHLNLGIKNDGTYTVGISSSAAWRKALVVPTQTDFTTTIVDITVGTLAANGGTKYNQTTAHGINTTTYRILGIISFWLTGDRYTNCTVTKLNTSGADIQWSVANMGTSATGSLTLSVRILKVAL